MKIKLSDKLAAWVEQQVKFSGYPTPDAFVEDALTFVKKRLQRKIEQQLLEGLDSGDPIEVTPEFWDEQRRKLDEHVKGLGKAAAN